MYRSLVAFLLATAATLPAQAQVNALPQTRHILVYGEAEARAIPDRFRIDIGVTETQLDVGAARTTVEGHMQALFKRLREAGVADADITATSLNITSSSRWDQEKRREIFLGSQVSRSLQARFPEREALERFLAATTTSEAIQISSVTTEVSSEAALRTELRQKAIASSREKARGIAEAYGARLGALYSVSDVAPQFDYGIREGRWPSSWQWNAAHDGGGSLDRIAVSGTRISGGGESFHAGYQHFQDKIYAVFLLAD